MTNTEKQFSSSNLDSILSFLCAIGFSITWCSFLLQVVYDIYPYFIAKHLDLLDTVFFVLRKKDNQVTFLHLYHHTTMVTWTWLHVMYHPTDNFVVVGMLNSFVHVLMYAYYGIASLGPQYQKYIWWKKHLTKVQLVSIYFLVFHFQFSSIEISYRYSVLHHAWIDVGLLSAVAFHITSYHSSMPFANIFKFSVSDSIEPRSAISAVAAEIRLVILLFLLDFTRSLHSFFQEERFFLLFSVPLTICTHRFVMFGRVIRA